MCAFKNFENFIHSPANVRQVLGNKDLGDECELGTGHLEVAQGPETKTYFSLSSFKEVTPGQKLIGTHLSLLRRDGGAAEYPTTPRKCLFRIAGVWFGYS